MSKWDISSMQMREKFVCRKKKYSQDVWQAINNRDSGVMVSIVAFQAVDRGSIPCCRIIFYNKPKKKKRKKKTCQKWDSNPRPHSWTRKPSATAIVEGTHPWVWRLRPLGHPDSGLRSSPLPFCSQTYEWKGTFWMSVNGKATATVV